MFPFLPEPLKIMDRSIHQGVIIHRTMEQVNDPVDGTGRTARGPCTRTGINGNGVYRSNTEMNSGEGYL